MNLARLLCAFVLCVASQAAWGQPVLRVKAGAPAGGDGSSWARAYGDLQAAIDAAPAGGEIWVAGGVYQQPPLRQGVAYAIVRPVSIYGGFAGNETSRQQRNPVINPTVLEGAPRLSIFKIRGVHSVTLNGLRLTKGVGSGIAYYGVAISNYDRPPGGAVFAENSHVVIINCDVSGNGKSQYDGLVASGGGAIFARSSTVAILNSTFVDNQATNGVPRECMGGQAVVMSGAGSGGAIECQDSTLDIDASVFRSNTSGHGGGGGCCGAGGAWCVDANRGGSGGAISAENSVVSIRRTRFAANRSGSGGTTCAYGGAGKGGAIRLNRGDATIVNCEFNANLVYRSPCDVPSAGGGGAIYTTGDLRVVNSTFYANSANGLTGGVGGAINGSTTPVVSSSIFWANDDNTGGVLSGQLGAIAIGAANYSIVQGLSGPASGTNLGLDPQFVNPLGPDNIPGTPDDNLTLRATSPAIDAGNNALYSFGSLDLAGNPRIIDDRFTPGFGPGPRIDIGAFEFVPCPADYDDGSGLGRRDGAVTLDDLLYYLQLFALGSSDADVDDGSGTGVLDSAVGAADLLYYLDRLTIGC